MKKSEKPKAAAERRAAIGPELDFAALEAYKLLRANLSFSLPEGERRCRIVGVTSAVRGEGKSTTCVNLAYVLAETGKKVMLLDADMRLPSIAKILDIPRSPGLSNMLTGMSDGVISVQKSPFRDSLYVITSGDIPPNPSELLGAKRMSKFMETLSKSFDYIVIDLPPVTVVSDALVISPLCDGMLLVARQNYTNRAEVARAVELLEYGKAKILGYVFNDSKGNEKTYQRRYRGRYYRYYYRKNKNGKRSGGGSYAYRYGYQDAVELQELGSREEEETRK